MVFAAETKSSLCVLNILAKHHPPPFYGFLESSVQTHCSRVYRQSQRHFNLSPDILFAESRPWRGLRPKRARTIIESAMDHTQGLYRCRHDGGEVGD